MRKCAFLTMDNTEGFVFDDELAEAPLRDLGWEVEYVSWSDPATDWNRFEIVIPRTTWDYHHHLEEFLLRLDGIGQSSARLTNPLELIRWNSHKGYLLDLEKRGVPIVPTIVGKGLAIDILTGLGQQLGTDNIIIKPTVGANADLTYPITGKSPMAFLEEVCRTFQEREYLAQCFVRNVITEGEFSLFYFNGELSHAILKKPKDGDFRVQEEHGGLIRAVTPEGILVSAGRRVMEALPTVPLYARADLVRGRKGRFLLMELELIEPALYLRMDERAPERFASAIDSWARRNPPKP